MTLKNVAQFYKEFTCHFKIDMKKFDKFWPKLKVSKICTLMGSIWTKYITLELKNYRGVIFYGSEDWCKNWKKSDLCFETIRKGEGV